METHISVILFVDKGLENTQQMFSDLNKHAVKPSKSIGILYDHRDEFSKLTKKIINEVKYFKNHTDLEKTTISNRSKKIFTLSGIYNATSALLDKKSKIKNVNNEEEERAIKFWQVVSQYVEEWDHVFEGRMKAYDLRQNSISGHAIFLLSIGYMGHDLINTHPYKWKDRLKKLKNIDWSRTNNDWKGRTIVNGKVNKSRANVILTSNHLKKIFNLKLDHSDYEIEMKFQDELNK